MSFTPRQQPAYRSALQRAFEAHCDHTGLNPDADGAFENWKVAFLLERIGVPSSSAANAAEHYDRVMLGLAQVIGDDSMIAYFASALERRMIYLVNDRRRKLEQLKGCRIDDAYLFRICQHIVGRTMPQSLDELPGDTLWSIFQCLDANVRSLRKQAKREQIHVP